MGHGNGGQAEYVVASARTLAPVPDCISWVSAAAFPNVYMTAHDALVTNGRLAAGETVLVNAASTGIGLATIEIARVLGAVQVVATTRSAEKAAGSRAGRGPAQSTSPSPTRSRRSAATDGRGVDIVDRLGRRHGLRGQPRVAGHPGTTGQHRSARVDSATIDLNALWRKRLKLIGVTFQTRSEEERVACFAASAGTSCAVRRRSHVPRSTGRSASTRSPRPTPT